MPPGLALALCGGGLLVLAVAVATYQTRRAARCPRHSPVAGALAWLLAGAAAAAGLALVGIALG